MPQNSRRLERPPYLLGVRLVQDMHFLNENGTVAYNPRDREAAHRAEMEGIATKKAEAVTCKKCCLAIRRSRNKERPSITAE